MIDLVIWKPFIYIREFMFGPIHFLILIGFIDENV